MVCCTDGSPGFDPACLPTDYGLPCLLLVGWFAVRTDLPVSTLPACPLDYSACFPVVLVKHWADVQGLTLLWYNKVKERKTTFCVCRAFGFLFCLYLKTLQCVCVCGVCMFSPDLQCSGGLSPGPFCVEFACSPRVHKGFPPLRTPTKKHAKRTEHSCLSLTETDGSLGPRALRSCPLLLEDPRGRMIRDGIKVESEFTTTSGLRVCVCVCVCMCGAAERNWKFKHFRRALGTLGRQELQYSDASLSLYPCFSLTLSPSHCLSFLYLTFFLSLFHIHVRSPSITG